MLFCNQTSVSYPQVAKAPTNCLPDLQTCLYASMGDHPHGTGDMVVACLKNPLEKTPFVDQDRSLQRKRSPMGPGPRCLGIADRFLARVGGTAGCVLRASCSAGTGGSSAGSSAPPSLKTTPQRPSVADEHCPPLLVIAAREWTPSCLTSSPA